MLAYASTDLNRPGCAASTGAGSSEWGLALLSGGSSTSSALFRYRIREHDSGLSRTRLPSWRPGTCGCYFLLMIIQFYLSFFPLRAGAAAASEKDHHGLVVAVAILAQAADDNRCAGWNLFPGNGRVSAAGRPRLPALPGRAASSRSTWIRCRRRYRHTPAGRRADSSSSTLRDEDLLPRGPRDDAVLGSGSDPFQPSVIPFNVGVVLRVPGGHGPGAGAGRSRRTAPWCAPARTGQLARLPLPHAFHRRAGIGRLGEGSLSDPMAACSGSLPWRSFLPFASRSTTVLAQTPLAPPAHRRTRLLP